MSGTPVTAHYVQPASQFTRTEALEVCSILLWPRGKRQWETRTEDGRVSGRFTVKSNATDLPTEVTYAESGPCGYTPAEAVQAYIKLLGVEIRRLEQLLQVQQKDLAAAKLLLAQ